VRGELGILGSDFQIQESNKSPNGAAITLALQDPSRWAIVFAQANTGVAVWISTLPTVGTNIGIPLVSASPVQAWNFRDLGALVQSHWFGFGGAGSGIQVIEVLYRPPGVEEVTPEMMAELAERMKGRDVLKAHSRTR